MLSVRDSYNEFVIKKSKFITYLFRVDNLSDIDVHLNDLNDKYKDATHICYAYIIDNVKRFSDDGEPSKTAGMPILGVLESNNLNHVLCCVVRYFGGIKLGANGLVRAYSNSCTKIIDNNIISLVDGVFVSIYFNYDKTKIIDNLLRDVVITNKLYNDDVYYEFKISYDSYNVIYNDLINNCISLKELGKCYIEIGI